MTQILLKFALIKVEGRFFGTKLLEISALIDLAENGAVELASLLYSMSTTQLAGRTKSFRLL